MSFLSRVRPGPVRVDLNAPFVTVGVDLNVQPVRRATPALPATDVTWNTLQHCGVLIVDTDEGKVQLTNLSSTVPFLLASGVVREYLDLSLENDYVRAEVQAGRGGELIRQAMLNKPRGHLKRPENVMVELFNVDRLASLYNHLASACTEVQFPCRSGVTLKAWKVETLTPDIPAKHTAVIKTQSAFKGWSRFLNCHCMVLELNGGRIGGSVGNALKTTTHVMWLLDDLSGYAEVPVGFLVRFQGHTLRRTGITSTGAWILQFHANSWGYERYQRFAPTDMNVDVWFGK